MTFLADLAESFVLGLLTPLGAVCVLPLYPGFLAYVSKRLDRLTSSRRTILTIALAIAAGVIAFMLLLGVLFTTILQVSLTRVIGVVSPIAFGILLVVSVLLLFDIDIGRILPRSKIPTARNPWLSALFYGFFFGAIVVPCNPLFLAVFFTRSVSIAGFGANLLRFLAFGIGIAAPLVALAALSTAASGAVIRVLTRYRPIVNRVAGGAMLGVSVYYLVFVFRVFDALL